MSMLKFFRRVKEGMECCFYLETNKKPTKKELAVIRWLLAETFDPQGFSTASFLSGKRVVELGPRMNFATAWNTNALSIFRACGIFCVIRAEHSRRYLVPKGTDRAEFIAASHDRMTECVYPEPLRTFQTGIVPEEVYTIPLIEEGPDALLKIPGISMDKHDRQLYYNYFVKKCGRNPTIVEIMDLNNANSEHSRHGFFKGRQIIDGQPMLGTLMDIVKSTLAVHPGNSMVAFCDNSSVIRGTTVETILPERPGVMSHFREFSPEYDISETAETHNFPSGVAPFPGAETGTGGRIRDVQATGRGGLVIAGTAGYCVGQLLIPGYRLPWEDESFVYPGSLARPRRILTEASNGASDYGNKFGEPVIQGFARSFGSQLSDRRREWLKPIMFTGGVGQIADVHLEKGEAEKGMLIVQIGGPAYRIGLGGGAASSMIQGENKAELDFNAVQRGDAEMEQKMNRVVRACVERWHRNPIVSIHDQGAGGPANVLKELVEKSGGRIELCRINLGDPTLSTLEIWVAEFQERNGLLIRQKHLEDFLKICEREKVPCEVLGEVTGDGIFTVHDEQDDSTPVCLHLGDVLGNMPQKEFHHERIPNSLKPLELPEGLTVRDALERVLRDVSVGSKRFLTNKVDRSVTGLIVRQQCCGPLQLTVADVAVVAQSHFPNDKGFYSGAAIAIGERPLFGLVNSGAQGRMTVAEMLTNIAGARLTSLGDIKCSGNWMWAPKLPGEGVKLYDTAIAMRDLMVQIGIAIDGGKDSLSMATKVKESGELVISPGQLVISGYCTMSDIMKVVTPDIKRPSDSSLSFGRSRLWYVDLANGKMRLGGSALAHCFKQIGDECPDMEDPELLKNAFLAVQELIDRDLILAYHDISDGGLIVTLLEMVFAGNCGMEIRMDRHKNHTIRHLFAEECGFVIEVPAPGESRAYDEAESVLKKYGVPFVDIGKATASPEIHIVAPDEVDSEVLVADMRELRQIWEETSYELDKFQCHSECVKSERRNIFNRRGPQYSLTFKPEEMPKSILRQPKKPRIAIIREEGSNGDREMTSAFHQAGFECWDITMTDLLEGRAKLNQFRGIAFVGGFSYADVLDSAKGWAGVVRFNPSLKKQFNKFYERPDTFSFGVCNGCQAMALLGWVPFKGLSDEEQPRFIRNVSGRFESRWTSVIIQPSPSIMLQGMENSVLGVWVAHGEGRAFFPRDFWLEEVLRENLAPVRYVDDQGFVTQDYPFNPNGSVEGIAGLCSPDGRHLAMMPHPERAFLKWQWAWMTEDWKRNLQASPWLQMFKNARRWCEEN